MYQEALSPLDLEMDPQHAARMAIVQEKLRWARGLAEEHRDFFNDLLDEHVREQYAEVVRRTLNV